MVLASVDHDHELLHVTWYATESNKQGSLELLLDNPEDEAKLHDDDHYDILGLDSSPPGDHLTLVVHHPSGECDEVSTHPL
jgi:aconitate hydratase